MNFLELLGALVGVVYLWLEYKASIFLWLAMILASHRKMLALYSSHR